MSDVTADRPAPGLVVLQPARGFRYGAESFWLSGFALEVLPAARDALDLGTGSGIAALLLARRGLDVLGIELRSEWRPLWEQSLARSTVAGRARLRTCDVRDVSGAFDLVVSNPPYFPAESGPAASDLWRATARTESTASLAEFVAVALRCLRPGGRACLVVPRDREEEVTGAGGHVVRVVRVGRRRSLVALAHEPGSAAERTETTEDGPLCAGWYGAVAGAHGPPYRDT